jgi:hypothetical protein
MEENKIQADLPVSFAGIIEKYLRRHIIPGLNFLVLLVLIPLLKFNPGLVSSMADGGMVFLMIVVALAIGFLLDAFKLYQLSPFWIPAKDGYKKVRDGIFEDVSKEYGNKQLTDSVGQKEDGKQLVKDFEFTAPPAVSKQIVSYKEQWTMCMHTRWIFLIGAVLWAILFILNWCGVIPTYWGSTNSVFSNSVIGCISLVTDLALCLAYIGIGLRFKHVAKEQRNCLNDFIKYQMGHPKEVQKSQPRKG